MSTTPLKVGTAGHVSIRLLQLPVKAIQATSRGIGQALASMIPKKAAPADLVDFDVIVPETTPVMPYSIADRVFIGTVDGQKVSFRQYLKANVITATIRQNRRTTTLEFTPAVADTHGLIFEPDGAMQWLRRVGLNPTPTATRVRTNPKPATQEAVPVDVPAAAPARPAAKRSPSQAMAYGDKQGTTAPATGRRAQPFTGKILFMGEVGKHPEGEKPYKVYSITLGDASDVEREFNGEHLLELTEKHNLQIGQSITLQLLGRQNFHVEVNGKMEPRSRNEYAITT